MKPTKDKLGDRIKQYEQRTAIHLMPMLPTVARVDGRAFSKFTRGMESPYDPRMHAAMVDTAWELCKHTNALLGYVQFDEISLLWCQKNIRSRIWFDGKHSKMVSLLGSLSTLHFYRACIKHMPEFAEKLPTFDARVFQVPDENEAASYFVWRERDATKNSIGSLAAEHYSSEELMYKNCNERQAMLLAKGINWNDCNNHFKRGTYIQRYKTIRAFTPEEIESLPDWHDARKDPTMEIERQDYRVLDMPPLSRAANQCDVVFRGADHEPIQENNKPTSA